METLLLILVFLSVVVLILTPWLKSGLVLAFGSLIGYFYFAGLDSWPPILLLIIGLILITLEIFIPDFGLLGILGVGSVGLGLYYTTGDLAKAVTDLTIALAVSAVFIVFLIRRGYSFQNLKRIVLDTQIKNPEGEISESQKKQIITVGMVGEAVTPLRPSGKVKFEADQVAYDVLSDDGHVTQGEQVIIQEIHGTKIIVRKIH